MGHSFTFKEFFLVLMNIIIVLLTILVQKTQSAQPQFKDCESRNCGKGPNISYPFYIASIQESFCGYPGFEISCKDEEPVLKMATDNYLVRDIFYTDRSLLVANAGAVENDCPVPPHNFTLDRTPFAFGPSHSNLFFFYNCRSIPDDNQTYPVTCSSNDTSHHSFAMFERDRSLKYLSYSVDCESLVSAPVDMEGGLSFVSKDETSLLGLLEKGFLLEWTASDCSECDGSGGRCGFYNKELVCICRDGPHPVRCIGGAGFGFQHRNAVLRSDSDAVGVDEVKGRVF